jgi:tripartite-type tricarboxylate transporter receptor subunit TctC
VVTVHPSVPARTLGELVAWSKANAGKVNYGSTGTGTTTHLQGELLRLAVGLQMESVPYKDSATINPDLITGRLQVGISAIGSFLALIRDGKMRPIVTLTGQRSPLLPEVPTASEVSGQDLDLSSWYGFLVKAGTPKNITDVLEREFVAVTAEKATQDALAKIAIESLNTIENSAAFRRKIDADHTRWERVVRELGLKPN